MDTDYYKLKMDLGLLDDKIRIQVKHSTILLVSRLVYMREVYGKAVVKMPFGIWVYVLAIIITKEDALSLSLSGESCSSCAH